MWLVGILNEKILIIDLIRVTLFYTVRCRSVTTFIPLESNCLKQGCIENDKIEKESLRKLLIIDL